MEKTFFNGTIKLEMFQDAFLFGIAKDSPYFYIAIGMVAIAIKVKKK